MTARQSKGHIRDWVNIRTEPNMESEKILKLRPGQEVEVVTQKGDYVLVRVKSIEGWIHRNRITY